MSCQDYELELGDYVDGTLEGDARAACEAHLATCARCSALVSDLRTIGQRLRTLEPVAPGPHVWTRLAAAVEAERGAGWVWGFNWRTLSAVASSVLIVASLSWVGGRLAPVGSGAGRLASAVIEDRPVSAEIDDATMQLTTAIAGLETIARTEQAALDADTADVLQANLVVIDGAISESRAALETEPDSRAAQDSLFEALRSKVELLQDIVALINEMRQGNQEGAARILSGLNQ
jgi:anti-sigma factor RsiW